MRPAMHKSMVKAGWFAGVYLAISLAGVVYGQDAQPQGQINIYKHGGTPFSYQIEAEADYIIAQGEFQKSVAIARKINAEAVAQEIQNSVDYVKAYFERRDINKAWREKNEYKTDFERLEIEQKAMEKNINEYFQNTLKGDVTRELNYMLNKLYFVQYMSPGDLNPLDSPLNEVDLKQIYLTDGRQLVFNASNPQALQTPWPYALRDEKFAKDRKELEDSREMLVREIQEKGQAGTESGERMMKAVNQLLVTLETVYPDEKRRDLNIFPEYDSAKNYLNSLIVQVNRARTTTDQRIFDKSLRFQGKTLLNLIQYMCQNGLMFSKPQPGGDRVYKPLFTNMRHLYLTMGSEKKDGGQLPAKN